MYQFAVSVSTTNAFNKQSQSICCLLEQGMDIGNLVWIQTVFFVIESVFRNKEYGTSAYLTR